MTGHGWRIAAVVLIALLVAPWLLWMVAEIVSAFVAEWVNLVKWVRKRWRDR